MVPPVAAQLPTTLCACTEPGGARQDLPQQIDLSPFSRSRLFSMTRPASQPVKDLSHVKLPLRQVAVAVLSQECLAAVMLLGKGARAVANKGGWGAQGQGQACSGCAAAGGPGCVARALHVPHRAQARRRRGRGQRWRGRRGGPQQQRRWGRLGGAARMDHTAAGLTARPLRAVIAGSLGGTSHAFFCIFCNTLQRSAGWGYAGILVVADTHWQGHALPQQADQGFPRKASRVCAP